MAWPNIMRVLHILDHGLPLHSGYAFRSRAILAAQRALGWEVAGLTGPRQGQSEAAEERIEGLRFFRTPPVGKGPPPLREWREIRAIGRRLDGLARDWRPDILHAHSPVLTALAALPVARRRRLPLIYEIRAFWEDAAVGNGTGREGALRYRLTGALETHAARRADAVAVICEGLKRDLVRRGIDAAKIVVAPNGVDMELFGTPAAADPELRRKLGLEGADVVGFIGSFYDYEGLDDLIAAMPDIVAARPKAQLLLVGGGPMEGALKAQAAASPAAAHIRFAGRVPHREVERYYALIDILAYPRKRMRLTELVTPLKPLEAMAQGRLVLASDVGGHAELIEDGVTGTLFPAGDRAALADALAELFSYRDGWEKRRRAARDHVRKSRNWSENILRYKPFYESMTGQAW
ncbi:MAG: TIGR04063 family PEP-CTERM/XrtA system glycosyltransferase [Sphingomonadaceae bacterium]